MIHISQGNIEYPFFAIDSEVLECLDKAIDNLSLGKNYSLDFQIIKRTLECTLQVTGQSLNIKKMKSSAFTEICISYIGAHYSPTFFKSSHHRKYRLVKSFLQLIARLEIMFNTFPLPTVHIAKTVITEDIEKCILQFESLELNEEKLWLWRGWPCPNKSGRVYWAPLYPIYKRLGRSFTYRLHLVCIEFVGTRNVTRVPLLSVLAKFIEQYEGPLDESDLKRPEIVGGFWRKFMTYYLLTKYANVRDLDIDLIDHINPFSEAYAILAKAMNEESLKQVQAIISGKKVSMSMDEARELARRALKFKQERGRLPSLTSADPWEQKMAEGVAYLARMKAEAANG